MGRKKKITNLRGKTFGRLKVLEKIDGDSQTNVRWLCRCSCKKQTIKIIRGIHLLSKGVKSCGCLRKEILIKNFFKRKTDLSGKKFGHLLILQEIHRSKNCIKYLCLCDCGNIIARCRDSLFANKNKTNSCGCVSLKKLLNISFLKRKDISNQKFGRLKAIKRVGRDKHRMSIWLCECECGNKTEVRASSLLSGHAKSCGCLKDPVVNPIRAKGFIKMQFGLDEKEIQDWMVSEKISIYKLKRKIKELKEVVK